MLASRPNSGRLGCAWSTRQIWRAGDANASWSSLSRDRHLHHPQDNLPGVMQRLRSGEKLPSRPRSRAEEKLASGTLVSVDNQSIPDGDDQGRTTEPLPNQSSRRMLLDTRAGDARSERGRRAAAEDFRLRIKQDKRSSCARWARHGRGLRVGRVRIAPGELVVVEGSDRLRTREVTIRDSRGARGQGARERRGQAAPQRGRMIDRATDRKEIDDFFLLPRKRDR